MIDINSEAWKSVAQVLEQEKAKAVNLVLSKTLNERETQFYRGVYFAYDNLLRYQGREENINTDLLNIYS